MNYKNDSCAFNVIYENHSFKELYYLFENTFPDIYIPLCRGGQVVFFAVFPSALLMQNVATFNIDSVQKKK